MDRWVTSPTEKYETANWSLRQGDEEVKKEWKKICLNNLFKYIYFLFYSFVYFFIALP